MIPCRRHKCALNICACLSGVGVSGDDIGGRETWWSERTFELEGEVICEMSAFVIATEEEEGVGVPDLERPQVQYALNDRISCRWSRVLIQDAPLY